MKKTALFLATVLCSGLSVANASKLVGIGAALDVTPNQTVVIRQVFANSPAAKAGLHVGDMITTVQQDGSGEQVPVAGKKLEEVVALIRGPNKTTVTLGILKPSGEMTTVAVVRDDLNVTPAKAQ